MELKMIKVLFANIPKDLTVVVDDNQFDVLQFAKHAGYKTRETWKGLIETLKSLDDNEIMIIPTVPLVYSEIARALYDTNVNVAILSPMIAFFGDLKQKAFKKRKADFVFLSEHTDRQHRVFNLKETANVLGVVWVLVIRDKTDGRVVFQELN